MKARSGVGVTIDEAKKHQCLYEQKFGMTDFASRTLRESDKKKAMLAIREWYPNRRIGDGVVTDINKMNPVLDNLKDDGTYDRVNRVVPTKE
jgi:hypothetical protein